LTESRQARLLLALDQVERMFVEAASRDVECFARIVRELVEKELAVVVTALRSDAFPKFETIADFTILLNRGTTFHLLPPTPVELENMILRPVAACEPPLAYERNSEGRSLSEVLIRDAQGGDALPLLQMTLQRLYESEEKRGDGTLRFDDYPGMGPAIQKVADEAFESLDPEARAQLPALIAGLVRDVIQDLKASTTLPLVVPLIREQFERGLASRTRLVDAFINARLMTTEETDGIVRVRPVHDALLRTWPKAADLIHRQLELIRVRNLLEPIVDEWARADGRRKDELLEKRPTVLASAAELNSRLRDDLSADMRHFIDASMAAERGEFRRSLFLTGAGFVLHFLPPTAAFVIFFLLAGLSDLYLSYLEGLRVTTPEQFASNVVIFSAAIAGMALISAAIYMSHIWLGALRLGASYSTLLHPSMGAVQRFVPACWCIMPWLGVVAGLFSAKLHAVVRYNLLIDARINPDTMNYLQMPGTRSIFISMAALALVVAFFLDRYRQFVILQSVTIVAIPVAAIGLFLLLTDLPVRALIAWFVGGLAIALICAICATHYFVPTATGINQRGRTRIALLAWAVLPWLAIGLYFVIHAIAGPTETSARSSASPSRWAAIPVAMTWVIAGGLAVVMALDYFRESIRLQWTIIGIIAVLMVAAGMISYGNVDTIVWLCRLLGPLASTMLLSLFGVSALILLAVLSRKSGFPAVTLVVMAVIANAIFTIPSIFVVIMCIVVCGIFLVMVPLSRLWTVAAMAVLLILLWPWLRQPRSFSAEPSARGVTDLRKQFDDWFNQRVVHRRRGRRDFCR
jgi:hypothetical protein